MKVVVLFTGSLFVCSLGASGIVDSNLVAILVEKLKKEQEEIKVHIKLADMCKSCPVYMSSFTRV